MDTGKTTNSDSVLDEARRVVDRAYRLMTLGRQYRRLYNALRRLGVTQITGDDWVVLDKERVGIRFGAVPAHRLAILIDHLEDTAVRLPLPSVDVITSTREALQSRQDEQLQLDSGSFLAQSTEHRPGGRS